MKLIHGVLGCLLAAGLTAHAANGTVIGNIVYIPLDIKLKVQYNDSKGKVHEASATSKDILKLLGFSKKDQLATDYNGFGGSADVVVIENGEIIADLTQEDIFGISFNYLVNKRNKDTKNGGFTDSEKGVVSLNFDFTGFEAGAVTPNAENLGEVSFEADGVYLWQSSGGATKNGEQQISTKLTAGSFVGNGFGSTGAPTGVIQPDAGIPGDGDFLIKDGSITGTGGGKVGVD